MIAIRKSFRPCVAATKFASTRRRGSVERHDSLHLVSADKSILATETPLRPRFAHSLLGVDTRLRRRASWRSGSTALEHARNDSAPQLPTCSRRHRSADPRDVGRGSVQPTRPVRQLRRCLSTQLRLPGHGRHRSGCRRAALPPDAFLVATPAGRRRRRRVLPATPRPRPMCAGRRSESPGALLTP